MTISSLLLDKRTWILQCLLVAGISTIGIVHIGQATYDDAPPMCSYVDKANHTVIHLSDMEAGQQVFLQRGFMTLGSFWGDGSERGPDFTADGLHQMVMSMRKFHSKTIKDEDVIAMKVQKELHLNGWKTGPGDSCWVVLTDSQVDAYKQLLVHHKRMFEDPSYPEYIRLGHHFAKADREAFTAYMFWGSWVTAANRPGETYSYTHNWPHDPMAGNIPTAPVIFWSALSILLLFCGMMVVLYVYGQIRASHPEPFNQFGIDGVNRWLTTTDLEDDIVRPTQRATYPFFALAMCLFALQVVAGIWCASDYVRPFGIFLGDIVPFSVARAYHGIFQIFWFFMCWVGYTIFFLPKLSKVPAGQGFLIKFLFFACCVIGVGTLTGIYMSHTGKLSGEMAYYFGSQGWEFMELGRFYHMFLLVGFSLWIMIIYRAVRPWLTMKNMWSVPAWLLYGSGIMVFFLFFGLKVAPRTNFAISNFWRWMVVHMWVEVTFEVFTTVIVAYMMVQMNFVSRYMAENTIFLAVLMFIFTATCGVAHNFYWIAKPTSVIALGSLFSTMQVLPLLLLTLDAWRMHKQTENADLLLLKVKKSGQKRVMSEVWLYLMAVNFWNVFGAGVFGSLVNLPIVNYFEHATYMTNNHAHGAMFGVKGNIALGGMLFCCQHLFPAEQWAAKTLRFSFWCLQIGIILMMFMDMFPVGLYQMHECMTVGFWWARSAEIVQGEIFRTLTYARCVGGVVFVFGGLLPLVGFVLSGIGSLKKTSHIADKDWPTYEKEWAHQKTA